MTRRACGAGGMLKTIVVCGAIGAGVLLLAMGCFLLAAVFIPTDYGVPPGCLKAEKHFDRDGWQDSVDYGKFFYASCQPAEQDARYHMVTEAEMKAVEEYFANFADWMEACGRAAEYDFQPGTVTTGDYVYIVTKEGNPIGTGTFARYDDYTVRLFDAETCVLYYIHANI